MTVAPTTTATLGDDKVFAGGHVHDDLIGSGIPDHGSSGNLNDHMLAAFAVHISALTVDTGGRCVFALIPEVQKGGQIVVYTQDHIAAMTAVAAVRAAGCYIFLPVKGNRTVTTAAAAYGDTHFIYKHRETSFCWNQWKVNSSKLWCPIRRYIIIIPKGNSLTLNF